MWALFSNISLYNILLVIAFLPGGSAYCRAEDPLSSIDRLIGRLGSENFEEREQAAKELVGIGAAALPALRSAAKNKDAEISRRAKECIPQIEFNEKVSTVAKKLTSASAKDRVEAARKLTEFGPKASKAVPALIKALDDPNADVQLSAVIALSLGMGSKAKTAAPKFIQLMQNQKANKNVRFFTMAYLGKIEPSDEQIQQVVPIMLDYLERDNDSIIKVAAMHCLENVGRKDKRVTRSLLNALDHKDPMVSTGAVWSLSLLGADPSKAVPAILVLLKKFNEENDPNESYRQCILRGLAYYGADAEAAVPAIMEIVKRGETKGVIFETALDTLRNIGPGAKDAVPLLRTLVKSRSQDASRRATEALKAIEGSPKPNR